MIVAKRAILVVGFEHDDFAFVVAEFVGLAVNVPGGEIRRGLAHLCCQPSARESTPCQKTDLGFHNFLSERLVELFLN